MEVVLQRAASASGFGLEQVDDVADKDLNDVEDEECESKLLNHGLDPCEGMVQLYDIPCACCRSEDYRH